MTLRRTALTGAAAGVLCLAIVACSGTAATPGVSLPPISLPTLPPASGLPVPSLALPSIGIPSFAVPSIAVPSIAVPSFVVPSFAIPSGLGSFAIPSVSLPSADKDLESRLPNQINGVTLQKLSIGGPEFVSTSSGGSSSTLDFLTALGKTPADLSVAFASDPNGTLNVDIGAFRIKGADSGRLLPLFVEVTQKESPQDVIQQGSVGGKNVVAITDPDDPTGGTLYIYSNGDTLFYAQSTDQSLAAAALQALP